MSNDRKIIFEIPYHIGIPEKVLYQPKIKGFPVLVKFETVNKGNLEIGGATTIKRERFGNTAASKVVVMFDGQFDKMISDGVPDKGVFPAGRWFPDRDGVYIKSAVEALNKVISAYRHVTGSYWVQSLNMGDIGTFEIQDWEDGDIVDTTERQITRGSLQMGGLSEDDIEKIGDIVAGNEDKNIYQELHLDIRDKIDLEDYTLSTLLSYILFERFVKRSFLMSVTKIKSKEKATDLAYEDDGQYKHLMHIIDLFSDHTDIDFKEFDNFSQWEDNLYEVRNDVVHEAYQPSFEEAGKAHEIAVKSIEWFQTELKEHLEGHPEAEKLSEMRDYEELDPMNMYQ